MQSVVIINTVVSSNPAEANCSTLCDKVCHWLATGRWWEYRRGNQRWTLQRKCQHRAYQTKKNKAKAKAQHNMCWTPIRTNNISKTWSILQTTGGKDEPNIVFMRKA